MADDKDTDAQPSGESEQSDQPTLTSLLEDWEKGASKAAPQEEKPSGSEDRVAALEYKLEMKDIIPTVKGEVDVSDKFVETYINMRATEDARLDELWRNRNTNRGAWDSAVKTLGTEFASFAKQSGLTKPEPAPKQRTRGDDKGLAAAAHMARESKPASEGFDSINWGELSPQEFAMKKSAYFRALKAGQET